MSKNVLKVSVSLIAVFLTFLCGFWLPFLSQFMPDALGKNLVSQGMLDGVELGSGKDIYLNGEWQFFKDQHIISGEKVSDEPDLYVKVPSPWTAYEIDGKRLSNGGKASYRAYIKGISSDAPYIITVPNVPGECRVFIDGECIYSNPGAVSVDDGGIGSNYAYPVYPAALSEGAVHEVVIEMTCEYASGLTAIPVLSEYESYQNHVFTNLAWRYLLVGVVLFFAVAVALFSAMRKDIGSQFWLVVLCISFIFRMLISNVGYMASPRIFTGFNSEIMMSLIFVSTYIIKLSMMMHLNNVAGLKTKQNTIIIISVLFLICAFVPYFLYDYIYIAQSYIWLQSVPYILDIVMIYRLSEAFVEKKRFSGIYLLSYCVTAAAIIVDNYYINGYISKSVSWVTPLACVTFIAFMVLIHFVQTVDAFSQAKEAVRLSKELGEINMTLMLSQIQPHFLYNALNTIKYLIKKDPKTAETAVVKFSNYLRANMDSLTQKEPIPFEKELEHVENYTSIERLRFGDRLKISYDIGFSSFSVPPLTIQPIVENAIKHGVNQRADGGEVKIITREEKESAVVIIEDNGVGFDVAKRAEDNRSHVGITNITARLKELMNATVQVESAVGEGTKITIKIPKEEIANENNGC